MQEARRSVSDTKNQLEKILEEEEDSHGDPTLVRSGRYVYYEIKFLFEFVKNSWVLLLDLYASVSCDVREYSKLTIQRNWQYKVLKTNKPKTQHYMCWTPLCANIVKKC